MEDTRLGYAAPNLMRLMKRERWQDQFFKQKIFILRISPSFSTRWPWQSPPSSFSPPLLCTSSTQICIGPSLARSLSVSSSTISSRTSAWSGNTLANTLKASPPTHCHVSSLATWSSTPSPPSCSGSTPWPPTSSSSSARSWAPVQRTLGWNLCSTSSTHRELPSYFAS